MHYTFMIRLYVLDAIYDVPSSNLAAVSPNYEDISSKDAVV